MQLNCSNSALSSAADTVPSPVEPRSASECTTENASVTSQSMWCRTVTTSESRVASKVCIFILHHNWGHLNPAAGAAFIPVAHFSRFVPPVQLFVRLGGAALAPFAWEVPGVLVGRLQLLKQLGVRDEPRAEDLVSQADYLQNFIIL